MACRRSCTAGGMAPGGLRPTLTMEDRILCKIAFGSSVVTPLPFRSSGSLAGEDIRLLAAELGSDGGAGVTRRAGMSGGRAWAFTVKELQASGRVRACALRPDHRPAHRPGGSGWPSRCGAGPARCPDRGSAAHRDERFRCGRRGATRPCRGRRVRRGDHDHQRPALGSGRQVLPISSRMVPVTDA
jgi:hypothetical protein